MKEINMNGNVWQGVVPPSPPQNPQVQVIMNQLLGHVNQSVSERLTPIAQSLSESAGRISQLEEVVSALIKKVTSQKDPESNDSLFDLEERRILLLSSSGFMDKKELKSMWDSHQSKKQAKRNESVFDEVGSLAVSGE